MFAVTIFGSRPFRRFVRIVMICGLVTSFAVIRSSADDEPRGGLGGLSRLFRLGSPRHDHQPSQKQKQDDFDDEEIARVPAGRNYRSGDAAPGAAFEPAVTSPGFGESTNTRLTARPKYVGPVTEAEPVLTRIGIARADSGNSFALFIQIYADGTVIDSEGVHRLPLAQIKPILSVIRGHDFSRIRGHCGQPSADFIENVQMVVYDRSMGRLRAHAFSYAGSPEGCDPSVAHLHKAVDDLILKISSDRTGESISGANVSTGPAASASEPIQVSPNLPAYGIATNAPNRAGSQPAFDPNGPVETSAVPVPTTIAPATAGGAIVPRLPSTALPSPFGQSSDVVGPELMPPR